MSEKKLSSTKQLNKRTSSFFNSEVVELNLTSKFFYGLKYIRQNRTGTVIGASELQVQ